MTRIERAIELCHQSPSHHRDLCSSHDEVYSVEQYRELARICEAALSTFQHAEIVVEETQNGFTPPSIGSVGKLHKANLSVHKILSEVFNDKI